MQMDNDVYDTLKWVAQIALPAFAALVLGVAKLWNLPYGIEIAGTITALDVFLGALLEKASADYQGDGQLIVDTSDPLKDIYSIAIEDYPERLALKDTVVLKVKHPAHMKE